MCHPRSVLVPSILQTLELDARLKTLFAIDEQCGPVDTRFKLDIQEPSGVVFIGRIAKNPIGALHLLAQVVGMTLQSVKKGRV